MSNTSYVILDTGQKGAMILYDDLGPVEGFVFKKVGHGINLHDIDKKLKEWKPEKIYVERIGVRPRQGAQQTATQFTIVGQCYALCELNCSEVEYIYPQTWTAFTKRLVENSERPSKEIAQELTRKYYPDYAQKYFKVKLYHDGIADCLAMNLYIQRDIYLDDILK